MPKVQRESIKQWVKTYCPYCGVGCGLLAGMRSGSVAKIKGDPDHPSSLGDLCLKAVYLPETLSTPDRLLYPQMRRCQDGPFTRVSWDTAIKFLAQRFRDIIGEHGRDAVAFYGSGQLTTEEYYVGNKLAKAFSGQTTSIPTPVYAWHRRRRVIKRPSARTGHRLATQISMLPIAFFSSVPTRPTVIR